MWRLFILFTILLVTFCVSIDSSNEPSQEEGEAAVEFDSNEIKPIGERKVLQPPSPAYNKEDIHKIETELNNESDKQNEWHRSGIERRMEMPMSETDEEHYMPLFRRSFVNESGLRNVMLNERRKNMDKLGKVDKKYAELAQRNSNKFGEHGQYAQAVDGKVDTLYEDHRATRKLVKATRGDVGTLKSNMTKHKAETDDRLKRHSSELKANGTRLMTIEEAVTGHQQQVEANMDTVVKQLGKNAMHENEMRAHFGKVLQDHGKHLDKTRNKLKNMKTRASHLYESVEVQGGALDKLGTTFGNVNDEMKVLKEIIVEHSIALKQLALHEKETVNKMMERQQILAKSVLESNKQVLELLSDFAHQLDNKVVDALENVNVQLAKTGSINDQKQQLHDVVNPNLNTDVNQQRTVPSLAEKVRHPLFLKKRDPRREQYEKKQQQQNAASSASTSSKNYEKLERPYAEEFKSASVVESPEGTAESSSTFDNALKALGLKKNGKKLITTKEAEGINLI